MSRLALPGEFTCTRGGSSGHSDTRYSCMHKGQFTGGFTYTQCRHTTYIPAACWVALDMTITLSHTAFTILDSPSFPLLNLSVLLPFLSLSPFASSFICRFHLSPCPLLHLPALFSSLSCFINILSFIHHSRPPLFHYLIFHQSIPTFPSSLLTYLLCLSIPFLSTHLISLAFFPSISFFSLNLSFVFLSHISLIFNHSFPHSLSFQLFLYFLLSFLITGSIFLFTLLYLIFIKIFPSFPSCSSLISLPLHSLFLFISYLSFVSLCSVLPYQLSVFTPSRLPIPVFLLFVSLLPPFICCLPILLLYLYFTLFLNCLYPHFPLLSIISYQPLRVVHLLFYLHATVFLCPT